MRLLLAQLNPIIGDINGNTECLKDLCIKSESFKADLILTPELSLLGYPPKDLLLKPYIKNLQKKALQDISKTIQDKAPKISILVGIAESTGDGYSPPLFNSTALINKNGWEIVARKQLLPTYDVFDEKRYFRSGESSNVLYFKTSNRVTKIGITICEDLWVEESLQSQRTTGPDPIEKLIPESIDFLVNLSASPFSKTKHESRILIAQKASTRLKCPVVYLNQIGGNDELIFDGSSFVLNDASETILELKSCEEDIKAWDTNTLESKSSLDKKIPEEELFKALVLGVKDYAKKCGFNSSIIGLSGGIDSALVAIIAAAAFGREKVTSLLMPSPWSSTHSVKDALELSNRIGSKTLTLPIDNLMEVFSATLELPLESIPKGITAENLQSRIRGILLMAFSNAQNHLLLSTGNKSELAVGYCTLYGDMNGGLSVIGDLYKTEVFRLCEWIDSPSAENCRILMGLPETGDLIGKNIRQKSPSAELRPGQFDTDSLPNYTLLDSILQRIIEDQKHPDELIREGFDSEVITQVIGLMKKGEFKRYQAPPLLKVSEQSFGSGWRLPIAAK